MTHLLKTDSALNHTNRVSAVRQMDPFNAQHHKALPYPVGTSLQTIFNDLSVLVSEHQDLVLFLNAKPVLRKDWGYQTQVGDHVLIKPYPQGGGGMRGIAQIAVTAAAMYVGGPAGAAIMIGGNLAINEFMPLPKPPSSQSTPQFSSTYQSQARSNVPKPMEPIPVQFGQLRITPDDGGRNYFAYENNKQVFHQTLVIGQGDYHVDESKITLAGDPIDTFDGAQSQVVQQGGELSMVNGTVTPVNFNYLEIEDSTSTYGNLFIGKGEIRNCEYDQDDDHLIFRVNNYDGQRSENQWLEVEVGDTIRLRQQYSDFIASTSLTVVALERGDNDEVTQVSIPKTQWTQEYYDYFLVLNDTYWQSHPIRWDEDTDAPYILKTKTFTIDSNNDIAFIEFDTAVPKGDQSDVSLIMETRTIDQDNNPITDWQSQAITLSRSSTKDHYESTRISVTPARYQVRFYRDDFRENLSDQVFLHQLKGFESDQHDTTMAQNCTLLALKVPVPEDQNITFGETQVVAQSILPLLEFNGSDYVWGTPQATSQISAALAQALRNRHDNDFESYLMPLDELYQLQQTWSARGDEFNGRFDQQLVYKEAMQIIARVGRAVALEQGDKWYFVRDEPGIATFPYSPANILANEQSAEPFFSISHKYPLADAPDGIIMEFFNREVWEWDETPSYPTDAIQPKRVRTIGITDKHHAWREACYLYFREIIKPSIVTWRTELEALSHGFGDLISVAPPKSNVYGGGVIEAYSEGVFTLSEELDWSDSGYHFLNLRKDDGTLSGPYEVSPGAHSKQCILKPGVVLNMVPHDGINVSVQREPTHYQFGKSGTGLMCRLISRKQVGDFAYELTSELVSDAAHTADLTPYPT